MEGLTKKELWALLECIKECYPICDLETFAQRVVSRLATIVPEEIAAFKVIRWQGDLRFMLNGRLAKPATSITTSLHQETIL